MEGPASIIGDDCENLRLGKTLDEPKGGVPTAKDLGQHSRSIEGGLQEKD